MGRWHDAENSAGVSRILQNAKRCGRHVDRKYSDDRAYALSIIHDDRLLLTLRIS